MLFLFMFLTYVVETTNISVSFSCIKMLSASTGDVTEFHVVDTPVTVHHHNQSLLLHTCKLPF